MKNLTIYNVYVEMQDQEQCDRMKNLCIDNNLPIWEDEKAFVLERKFKECFVFFNSTTNFFICKINSIFKITKTKVTEEEFINLLKQHKND